MIRFYVMMIKSSKGNSINLSYSEKDKLLIKDVRAMYKELESHLSKG